MSILHRRRQTYMRSETPAQVGGVPVWRELVKLDNAGLRSLASSLGIEYTTRQATLSAVHKAR